VEASSLILGTIPVFTWRDCREIIIIIIIINNNNKKTSVRIGCLWTEV
jgi:hypothetical protein